MIEFSLASVAIVGTWALLWALLTGSGLLVRRALGDPVRGTDDLLGAFWPGYAATLAGLQALSLALPMQPWGFAALLLGGLTGLGLNRRLLGAVTRRAWRARRGSRALVFGLVFAVGLLLLAALALRPIETYDTGLYHLASVRWAELHAVPPGLANLHCRLGFNNANHLFGAALDAGPWDARAHVIATGLVYGAAWLRVLQGLARWRHGGRGRRRAADAFVLALVPGFAFYHWMFEAIASFAPEPSCALLWAMASEGLLRLRGADRAGALRVTLLACAALETKLSCAVTAFVLVAAAAGCAARRVADLAAVALVGVLALAPWCARTAVLTGYPLYPSTVAGLPVDWRVPRATADEVRLVVRAWARARESTGLEERVASWSWLPAWRENQFLTAWPLVDLPLALGVLGLVLAARRRGAAGTRTSDRAWALALAGALGGGFWFVMAPDPRFLGPTLWLLPAAAAAALARVEPRLAGGALLGLAALTLAGGVPKLWMAGPPVVWLWALLPAPNGGVPPIPPTPRTQVLEYPDGLRVLAPTGDDRLWDAPLLSTGAPSDGLRWRRRGDLGAGFRIEAGEGPR